MATMRRCAATRCPHLVPASTRHCPTHARAHEARRGTTTQRGYGTEHQRLRAMWQARLDQGERVACPTCGKQVSADPKLWDLGHDDDRSRYLGPQHVACNRATSVRR